MPGLLNRFGKTLRELEIRQIKTQVNTLRSLDDAESAFADFARYYNYDRLHGEIGWFTPGERFDGTPFTDRGFDHVPALSHLVPWLAELRAAA